MNLESFCKNHNIPHATVFRRVRKLVVEQHPELDDEIPYEGIDLDFEQWGFRALKKVAEWRFKYEVYDDQLLYQQLQKSRIQRALTPDQSSLLIQVAQWTYDVVYQNTDDASMRGKHGGRFEPESAYWDKVKDALDAAGATVHNSD